MKKLVLSLGLFSIVYLLSSASAAADVTCTPIYGGGQTCVQAGNVLINKTVANPQTGGFVDNLGVNDPKYAPEQIVTFQLVITNTGGTALSKVTVRDILPQFVNFNAGAGSFDSNTRILSFDTVNLNPNESRTFIISGKVVAANQLPATQEVTCVVNQANATADDKTSQDNAQFCIQKAAVAPTPAPGQAAPPVTKGGLKVFAPPQVTTTPPTGPQALALIALLPTGVLGYFIRRQTNLR